jgi:OOP family OmpA-OmpF porin
MKHPLILSCLLLLLLPVLTTAQELKPTPLLALLTVSVVDGDKKALEGEEISFTGTKNGKTFQGITAADGTFKLLVPNGDDYKVKYKSFTKNLDYKVLKIPAGPDLINFNYTINVHRGKTIELDDVFFDTGKSTLRPESNKALNELASFMNHKKSMKIEIGGHTDNVGEKAANEKLSADRAQSVKAYLVAKGVQADRVVSKGYGDTVPVAPNETPEGRQKNRRTEVKVISE